jgi:hypothetical protein
MKLKKLLPKTGAQKRQLAQDLTLFVANTAKQRIDGITHFTFEEI